MADALAILRRGHAALPKGILIPEIMVRAAQLEGVTLPVAAAILEGETAGGKNIWGADGGLKVRTNGTYTPRTPVTQANYLAYRTEMRAGRIIRQGAGPCQATSAQYQDTADALGGCWDMLANCRSGFRGMGALIKAHGVRGGSRRYNGSGPNAEAYADRFVLKHERWRALGLPDDPNSLRVPTAATSAAATAPNDEGEIDMIDRPLAPGQNTGTIILPVGSAAGPRGIGDAWLSIRAAGGVTGTFWFQRSADSDGPAPGAGRPFEVRARSAARPYAQVPDGTEFIEYQLTAGGPGAIAVELFPK